MKFIIVNGDLYNADKFIGIEKVDYLDEGYIQLLFRFERDYCRTIDNSPYTHDILINNKDFTDDEKIEFAKLFIHHFKTRLSVNSTVDTSEILAICEHFIMEERKNKSDSKVAGK